MLGQLDKEDAVGYSRNLSNNSNDGWRRTVGFPLAKYYGCRMITSKRGNEYIWTVVGRQSARVTFEAMWPYVDMQVVYFAREARKAGYFNSVSQARTSIGNALAIRIWGMVQADEAEKEKTYTVADPRNALVPVDMISAQVSDLFPKLRISNQSIRTDIAGETLAKRISIHRQVKNAPGVKQLT